MAHLQVVVILIWFLLVSDPASAQGPACMGLEDKVIQVEERFGRSEPIAIQQIRSDIRGMVGKRLKLSEVFPNAANEAYLGISKGHFYLVVGGHRIDGSPILGTKIREHKDIASPGLLVRFKDITLPQGEALKNAISGAKPKVTFSCVQAACKVLQGVTGAQVSRLGGPMFTSITMRQILSQGFRSTDGAPVKFEVYRIGSTPLQSMLHQSVVMDVVIGGSLGTSAIGYAVIIVWAVDEWLD